jgi:hypothetical protein
MKNETIKNGFKGSVISRLVELAKAEYGEFKQEFIGYKVGNQWIDDWDFDVIPFEKIKDESTYINPITDKDLENLSKSIDEFFYCEDNSVIIRRCYNVINKGWKRELLHLINDL